jgi:cytochrome c553
MSPVAATLTDADMANLAAHYAAQTRRPALSAPRDPEQVAAGQLAFDRHHCVSCHAPGFAGPRYAPRLPGLHSEYLLAQLRGFKAQTRGELDGTMTTAAQPLTAEEIESLVHYIASLPP